MNGNPLTVIQIHQISRLLGAASSNQRKGLALTALNNKWHTIYNNDTVP